MVAKSRPRRRRVFAAGPLKPDESPAWVLAFRLGYFPNDPVRQAARLVEFHEWRKCRADWFEEQGLPVNLRACNEEHRRRAAETPGRAPLALARVPP
jgi:hypothetical protein